MMSKVQGFLIQRFCIAVLVSVIAFEYAGASITLEDFESGSIPSGWNVTTPVGTSWKVGGATGTIPNILAPEGSYFARSGEPNSSTESDTGVLTSPAYTVTYSALEWLSVGWSGGPGENDNSSYFQILDSALVEMVKVPSAQSDGWINPSVNLLDIGLLPGATFYFRAVDGRNQSNYGWIGFDELKLAGDKVEIPGTVPEPTSVLVWGALTVACIGIRSSRRRRHKA